MKNKEGNGKQNLLVWGLLFLVVLLLGVVIGLVITIGVNKEDKKDSTKENKTTLKADNDIDVDKVLEGIGGKDYLSTETINVNLDGDKVGVTLKYKSGIEGDVRDNLYGVYVDIFVNEKKVNEDLIPIYYTDVQKDIQNYKKYKLTEKDLTILFADIDYLLIDVIYKNPTYTDGKSLYIVDKQGTLVEKYDFGTVTFELVKKDKMDKYGENNFYVDGRNLYYLEELDDENCRENVVTIRNSKIKKVDTNKLEITAAPGGE